MSLGESSLGSAEIAHETIDLMAQHGVQTTAPNYEVWLTHRIGANPELSRQVEEYIVRGVCFTDSINDDLFERFFSNTRLSAQMMETGECIARELADVLEALKGSGDQTTAYSGALQSAASSFENSLDVAKLRDVVAGLANATREMARNNNELFAQIQSTTAQMASLQSNLKNAEAQARNDSLTGLANRRSFDQALTMRVAQASASGRPLCLMMCDIDHFKRFNDTWGHQVGDQVIRFIAMALTNHAAGEALAARYGGEEFALILPGLDLAEAYRLAAAIHAAVRSKKLVRKSTQQQIGVVTLSMGLSMLRAGEGGKELLARADALLYASKRSGRDRITADSDLAIAAA